MTACLGVWDPAYSSGSDTARHFNAAYDPATLSPNAVRVQATQTVPILFVVPGGRSRQLHAEAIASGSRRWRRFPLGSGLLAFNSANSLLGLLLGNSVNFSAVDWQGLVDANVTLDQLRLKLGVGTVSELLNARLTLQQFDALVLGAAGKDALLNTALGSPPTQLGASGASANMTLAQLINLGVLAPASSSAAEVGLNVANLLLAGAQLANGNAAVTVPVTGTLPAGLGGLSASLRVIQPPVMAVGPARKLSDSPVTWQTTAHTAQVGLALSARVNTGVANLNVPLYVEAVRADASLTSLQCAAAPADRRATLHVAPSLVRCLSCQCGRYGLRGRESQDWFGQCDRAAAARRLGG
ncbi:TadG family pilus assembly protein [Cupriavidus basilensis]